MLNIQNFSKTYDGKKKAVDGLSLSVAPGDIYGFIGANGAGKTSTIKAIAGIHDFEGGSITVCGHSIKTEPLICKKILAYIPDNPDLYEHLTGYQYLTFIADLFGISASERRAKIKKYGEPFFMFAPLSCTLDNGGDTACPFRNPVP